MRNKTISKGLDISVLPGIEVDLEGGHLLVIAAPDDVEDFASKCHKIHNLATYPNPNVNLDEFKEVFPDLASYILIPHYDKSPKIKQHVLEELSDYITAGEVQVSGTGLLEDSAVRRQCVKVGAHQGSVFSPLLFILVIDVIADKAGGQFPWERGLPAVGVLLRR